MASSQETLLKFYGRCNDNLRRRAGKDRAGSTVEVYDGMLRDLSRFVREKYGLSDIPFPALTYSFIESYDFWMRIERRLKPGTIINRTGRLMYVVEIPLLPIAVAIIEKYRGSGNEDKLLPVPALGTLNANLKTIAKVCGIERNVTYHVGRHDGGVRSQFRRLHSPGGQRYFRSQKRLKMACELNFAARATRSTGQSVPLSSASPTAHAWASHQSPVPAPVRVLSVVDSAFASTPRRAANTSARHLPDARTNSANWSTSRHPEGRNSTLYEYS
jgi:hypothetical protein